MIDIKHLYKSYGKKPVLEDITLSVKRGSILGLLGPNGAGKTTLISILTGVIGKNKGNITIAGLDLDRQCGRIQAICSYVPQALAFYPRLSAYENLQYFGSLWGLRGKALKARMEFCIDIGSMQAFVNRRVDKWSGGMKRRLNLAIGLLNEPEILYLDEPTVGVDAQSRNYILETIRKINGERKTTIIYTSHYMDEIEQISDDIAVIDHGKIILHDEKKAILKRADTVFIQVGQMEEAAVKALNRIHGIEIEGQGIRVKRDGPFGDRMATVFAVLREHGIAVTDVLQGHGNLEELFLELTHRRLRDEDA